ncbi:MAG: ABC transporter substrate-binding protein [Desulfobacterales bacterium]|jgi:ABC-type transport system substrate-binding protein|nr:ABC transporter substrate-binding protein [Desulfobacterales bacterium]
MGTRKLLILLPVVTLIVLLQSYFWVPTYEAQTKGNPHRLDDYITGSIGDAGMLNPILSSDSASSEIEALVFEGLIDRDEQLRYRGRLAKDWQIYEEAYFYINETALIPGFARAASAEAVAAFLKETLPKAWPHVTEVSLLPPERFDIEKNGSDNALPAEAKKITVSISAPARIKLTLSRVDPELFENLGTFLGPNYFKAFPSEKYVSFPSPVSDATSLAAALLPSTEHNPILLFHLRPNVTFHDGHGVDARDVQFTYEAIVNPRNLSPRIPDYEPVKAVQVVDPLTVKIIYKRLYSPAISSWAMGILPEHLLNDQALKKEAGRLGKDPSDFSMRNSGVNQHPVGCGPFRFREWRSDQHIVLDRFDDYWEGAPHYKRYIFRIIPDVLTQEMEFYAGTVDNYGVQPHQVARLVKDTRFQNFSGVSFGYSYIGYNMRREPFNDPRVRRALGMAIDTNKIIRYVLDGQAEPITGPFVKQTDYYNHEVPPLAYDPEGALALLASAGWKKNSRGILEKNGKPFQFTLITNNGNDQRRAILAIAQDAWKRIGIDVRTDLLEWSVFIQKRVNQLDFDALILGWQMGIDPDLYQLWHSSQTNPYQLNFVSFKNPEADDLIIKIRQEYNHERQVAYCRRLHRIIADAQPYTFLYVGKWTAVLDKRIVIKETGPDGHSRYKKITPTKTGNFNFHFNRWIKLSEPPVFAAGG